MKDDNYVKGALSSLLIILIAALIENAILSNIVYLPAVPDLCLICVLFISLHNGRLFGESCGFFSGLCLGQHAKANSPAILLNSSISAFFKEHIEITLAVAI